MTFPRNVGQVPIYYSYKRTGRPQGEGPTAKFRSNYLDVPNDPLFPFGSGLSYTTFEYSDLQVSSTTLKGDAKLNITVAVKNTGGRSGKHAVELYTRDLYASITPSMKRLRAFQKINLNTGESKQVTFTIDKNDLAFVNAQLKTITEAGDFEVMIGDKKAKFNYSY